MPGHTINKLLTPPDFLQHTPVPHVEKSSHACRKTSDHLHAVKAVIDYSVKEPHISNSQSFEKPMEIWPNLEKLWPMRSVIWTQRNTVVKLTVLARV